MSRLTASLPWPFLLLLLTQPLSALDLPPADAWQKTSSHYGITISMAHRDHERLKTVRAEAQFALADHRALGQLLAHPERFSDWWHMVNHVEGINVNDGEEWYYLTTRLPLFIPNRDAVIRVEHSDNATAYVVSLSSRPDRHPPDEQLVRIPELAGEFHIRILDEQDVMLTYQLILDPGGRVPPMVADSLLREHALYTVKALRLALPQ